MSLQLQDGPLSLRGSSIFGGIASDGDAGRGLIQRGDELSPALEALLLVRQEGVIGQTVARQRQRLLDQVLRQVQVLRHRVDDTQTGVLLGQQLPQQVPVPLGKSAVPTLILHLVLLVLVLVLVLLFPLLLFWFSLLTLLSCDARVSVSIPLRVQVLLKGLAHVHLVDGREGFGWTATMSAALIHSVTSIKVP